MAFTEIGANTLDTGYDIENSCRFNTGDSPALSYSISSTASSWTVSFWLKSSNKHNDNTMYPFSFGNASNDDATGISFSSGGLAYYNEASATATLVRDTSVLLRDPSAWYHVVCKNDGGTITTYLNGVQQASGSGGTSALDGTVVYIGRFASTSPMYLDAYISEFYFIDGTAYSASTFGETNDNGVWIPIEASPTFGSDGFFCEFKQTGTSANSSGIGADTSGNDNHLTVTNLAATDVTTDTPTNNFATLNPLANALTNPITLSEGNLKAVGDSSSWEMISSTIGAKNGKWYWEVKLTALSSYAQIGITNAYAISSGALESYFGHAGSGVAFGKGQDATIYHTGGNSTSYGTTYSAGDMASVALDLDNNFIYFAKDGTWMDYSSATGDPTSGSSGTGGYAITANELYIPAVACNQATWEVNFGNPSYANSSSVADANGYGAFEYAPPSGYYALCTKNLGEYG